MPTSVRQCHEVRALALPAALMRITSACSLAARPKPFVQQVTCARNLRGAPVRHSVQQVRWVHSAGVLGGSCDGQRDEFSLQGSRGGGDAPEKVAGLATAPAAKVPFEAGGLIGIGARGREPRRIRAQETSGHIRYCLAMSSTKPRVPTTSSVLAQLQIINFQSSSESNYFKFN